MFTLVPIKNRSQAPCSGTKSECSLRLRSDLVPEHCARERFLMGTSVNTPKLQVPTPEFGHGARARVQVLGHYIVLGALEFPVSEHNTILFQCAGTNARAPNMNTALVVLIKWIPSL